MIVLYCSQNYLYNNIFIDMYLHVRANCYGIIVINGPKLKDQCLAFASIQDPVMIPCLIISVRT